MNYTREINAFYDWLETNLLSSSGIVLWHALMAINNKAGWAAEFGVAVSTLETKTGLKKDAIYRARNRLQQLRRIDFKSRTGQQSAIYKIIPFERSELISVAITDARCDTNRSTNRAQSAKQGATQTASINILNNYLNTNNNTNKAQGGEKSLFLKFEQEFSRPLSPIEIETIFGWEQNHPPELVLEALKRAVMHGKLNIRYIDRILMDWEKSNVLTLLEVKRRDQEFAAKRKGEKTYGSKGQGNGNAGDNLTKDGVTNNQGKAGKYDHIDFTKFEFQG